jgi:hypothetical protein
MPVAFAPPNRAARKLDLIQVPTMSMPSVLPMSMPRAHPGPLPRERGIVRCVFEPCDGLGYSVSHGK